MLVLICLEMFVLVINWMGESEVVFVGVSDPPELIKRTGLRSRSVKNCYELTGNVYGRFQTHWADGKVR